MQSTIQALFAGKQCVSGFSFFALFTGGVCVKKVILPVCHWICLLLELSDGFLLASDSTLVLHSHPCLPAPELKVTNLSHLMLMGVDVPIAMCQAWLCFCNFQRMLALNLGV